MTGPVTTEALVEDGCRAVYGKNWDGPPDKAPGEAMRKVWRDLVAKAQAPLPAAHQQVTAERDEARERVARLEADIRAAVVEIGNQARARGEAEGALRISEAAGIVDGWRERAASAEASLATATSELARLRAEGEAKDRALQDALKAAIRAWSAKLHIPVTRMMSRELRAEFSTALARAATAREG